MVILCFLHGLGVLHDHLNGDSMVVYQYPFGTGWMDGTRGRICLNGKVVSSFSFSDKNFENVKCLRFFYNNRAQNDKSRNEMNLGNDG